MSSSFALAAAVTDADVDAGAKLKPRVNGLMGSGDVADLTTDVDNHVDWMEQLQDGLSCNELFKNGDGLTYK